MLKINDTKHPSMIVHTASHSDLETGRRFIVPIPSPDADLNAVARRIWELANATGSCVQFLGLCNDAMRESALRRALATISAMVNYGNVSSDFEIVYGDSWVKAIRSRAQAGDTVVCWHKQEAGLTQVELDTPVYFITGIYPENTPRSNWPIQVAAWLGSIAIIIGFFFLQVQIDRAAKEWVAVLQLLSLAGEFGLLWSWNNLLG
jgi:hypothetical protein